MHVVHPNIPFTQDLKLKKACVLYMPAWYTHRFTVVLQISVSSLSSHTILTPSHILHTPTVTGMFYTGTIPITDSYEAIWQSKNSNI